MKKKHTHTNTKAQGKYFNKQQIVRKHNTKLHKIYRTEIKWLIYSIIYYYQTQHVIILFYNQIQMNACGYSFGGCCYKKKNIL